MRIKDISFKSPQENLVFDDALLQLAEKHEVGEALRFWESPVYFIVLGRIGKEEDDVNLPQAQSDGIAVLRRSSGGGTVVQGQGCLNYSLILSKHKYPLLNDLRQSYSWISQKVCAALKEGGIEAYFRPISDMATGDGEKKFSGNAQKRGKNYILHHGTLLYDFDLKLINRYLKMPQDIPEYRKGRGHGEFVTNIPLNVGLFKKSLCAQFQIPYLPQPLTDQEDSFLKNLLK